MYVHVCHGVHVGHRTTCRKGFSLSPLSPWTKSISTHIFAGIMCRCESISHMPQDSLLCHSLKAFHLGFGNRVSHSVLDSYACRLAHKPQRSACPVTMHNYSIWFSKLTSGPYACLESTLLSWISRTMPPSLFWCLSQGLMSSRLVWSSYIAKG